MTEQMKPLVLSRHRDSRGLLRRVCVAATATFGDIWSWLSLRHRGIRGMSSRSGGDVSIDRVGDAGTLSKGWLT